jgi:transposase InsO family protein
MEETFSNGIIPTISFATHALCDAMTELVHHCDFATRAEAKQEIFEYIEVLYNRKRRHSANDYKSPADYEMSLKAA